MSSTIETLLAGETALSNAPKTELADGRLCVPQHYLSYSHTLPSVEALVLDIEYDARYPVFVCQDAVSSTNLTLPTKRQEETAVVYENKENNTTKKREGQSRPH